MIPTTDKLTPRTVNALDYRSANDLMNCIQAGKVELPVWIKIGCSEFGVTKDNMDTFAQACLFATDEAWDR